jgi:L-rhamnose mutarotase
MNRMAFVMQLHKGFEEEYQRRHDELWPELSNSLKNTGISMYSIFLHPQTNQLFAVFNIADEQLLKELPNLPVMKKWWNYMKDIMETNTDESPVSITLKEVFYLP